MVQEQGEDLFSHYIEVDWEFYMYIEANPQD